MFEIYFQKKVKRTFYVQQFVFEYRAVYVTVHKINLEPDGSEVIIWRTRIACCTNKATDTHSEFIILGAFPLQQWLQKGA
jgi:hypothetical protein